MCSFLRRVPFVRCPRAELLNSNRRDGNLRSKRRLRAWRGSLKFLKPRTHVLALSTRARVTVFTVWTVDSQDRQQKATPMSQGPPSFAGARLQRLVGKISIDGSLRRKLFKTEQP